MARLSGKRLADFSHRLAVAGEAGVDVRRTWQREADNSRGKIHDDLQAISNAVKSGGSLSDAAEATGDTFPSLWRDMLGIGEKTGQLPEVLHRLSGHYQFQYELGRTFLGLIAWPVIQLGLAILIVGLLIVILGLIGGKVDPLGWGLIGFQGAAIYFSIVGVIGAALLAIVLAIRRGAIWIEPIQKLVTSTKWLGTAIQNVCLAKIAWALHLTLNVEMDLRQLVPLVLRASGNAYYTQHTDQMVADITVGRSLYETFLRTHAFPPTFLDALQVAEESGQISESMARLTSAYEQEARSGMQTIAHIASFAVWACVTAIIVFMIFRLFFFYLNTLNAALDF